MSEENFHKELIKILGRQTKLLQEILARLSNAPARAESATLMLKPK
jgi:hypothetical protein